MSSYLLVYVSGNPHGTVSCQYTHIQVHTHVHTRTNPTPLVNMLLL